MDSVSKKKRSEIMARVHNRDTKPELLVRKLIYSLGYRYRLHLKSLPGKPDVVFKKRKKIIFIHGCFWHQHAGCKNNRPPKSRREFWLPKLKANREKDEQVITQLSSQGWNLLIIWECELRDINNIENRIKQFLGEK